jgi:hypothetical protein
MESSYQINKKFIIPIYPDLYGNWTEGTLRTFTITFEIYDSTNNRKIGICAKTSPQESSPEDERIFSCEYYRLVNILIDLKDVNRIEKSLQIISENDIHRILKKGIAL